MRYVIEGTEGRRWTKSGVSRLQRRKSDQGIAGGGGADAMSTTPRSWMRPMRAPSKPCRPRRGEVYVERMPESRHIEGRS